MSEEEELEDEDMLNEEGELDFAEEEVELDEEALQEDGVFAGFSVREIE